MKIAESIARMAHHGQRDKAGRPYIEHVRRVARAVSPPARDAAWLHDVLEDCAYLTEEMLLSEGIDRRTVQAVKLLTRRPPYDYATYIQEIASSGNALAAEVKVADLKDHLRGDCPESLRPRYEAALRAMEATA